MSDEIRIISIELENYRQYYGKHKINFSSRNEGFTVISGKNGEGKSNLLNSISWCLYHVEPHGMRDDPKDQQSTNKSLSVINNRYIMELDEEKIAKTSVEIQLQKGDNVYSISRVLPVLKHKLEFKELHNKKKTMLITDYGYDKIPKGCEIMTNQENFVIKKKGTNDADFHDTLKKGHPNTVLEEILPQGLSKYFLLDGEFLESIWKNPDIVKTGIEQISQLHLLSSLKSHVDKIRNTSYTGAGKDTDELSSKIKNLLWINGSTDEDGNEKFSEETRWKQDPSDPDVQYHATGQTRIDELRDDIKKMQDRQHDINRTIPNINIPSMKLLTERHQELENQLEKEKKNRDDYAKVYRYNLITKSPYIFLKEAIENTVEIIQNRMKLGDLPIRQRKQFADDLLKRGTCICGESLDSKNHEHSDTSKRISNIENFKNDLIGKGDLDEAVDMKYYFTHDFIDKYDNFLKTNFGDPRMNFTSSESKHDKIDKDLQGIRTQLKKSGSTKIEELLNEHEYLKEQIQIKNDMINRITLEVESNKKTITNLRIQLEKGLKKNKKAWRLAHELDVWNTIHDHVAQVYNELEYEIRISIQDNTWSNFKKLLANSTEFDDFAIEPDYAVYLQDQFQINKIRNLSAGQSLILTLAFVSALREPTGYKFPLVIDSPLGKIDSANKYNISQRLPEFLPDEQLTLLVIDTEYAGDLPLDSDNPNLPKTPFGALLEEKISVKHLKIQKEKAGANKGNSTIKPAKFVMDEKEKRWMVVANV